MDGNESGDAAAPRPASPRRRLLLGVGVFLLVVRVALPFVLRPLLVARADAALVGHVELEDLDLSLLRGGVTLHGFSIHTEEADERPASSPPLFEARRLWTQISWLALLTRTLEIEDFELEGFTVRLDRFADGLLLPKPAPDADAPTDDDADAGEDDASSGGWSLAGDAITLRDGRVELHDHTVAGPPETFTLDIEDFTARELAIRTDPADGEPGRVAIEAKLDQGSVSLAAWIEQSASGLDVKTNLVLDDLPLDRVRAYLPMFAWNALKGRIDASLEHHFVSGGANELRGKASIASLEVGVPGLDVPALAWTNLEVVLDRLDLAQHRVELAAITSTGARVVVAPRAPHPLPLLAPPPDRKPDEARQPAVAPEPANEAEAEARPASETRPELAPDEKPWTWRIAEARLDQGVVELRGGATPVEVDVAAALRALSSEAGSRAPIELTLTTSPGTLALAGELSLASASPSSSTSPTAAPVAFAGRLSIRDLALAPLLATIDAPAVHWLHSGSLRSNLRLSLARDLRVAGTVGVADLQLEEASTAKQFGVDWKDLEIGIASLVLPDVSGGAASAAEATAADPTAKPASTAAPSRTLDVSLTRVALVEPRFLLTRDAKGLVLPPLEPGAAKNAATEGNDATDATTTAGSTDATASNASPAPDAPAAAKRDPATTPAAATPLGVKLAIAELEIRGGRGKLADRAIEPYYRGRIESLDAKAKGVRWPAGEIDALELALTGLHGAKLEVKGALSKERSTLEGELVELELEQFNPYLTSTGYSLRRGALSLQSKGRLEGDRFKTRSRVVVSSLDLGGSEAEPLFQESFGVPLSVALGLLTDLDGRITLAVPVAGRRDKVEVGLARIVGQALRKALVGALASPLKLLGAVARDGKVATLAPEPIVFEPGGTTLSNEGNERVEAVAGLLAASPGIRLVLTGQTTADDERILRERDLLAALESTRGVRALAALGEIGIRRTVREHLARRLAGKPAPPLAPDAARWLESQLASRPLAPDALAAMGRSRAEAVRALLASEHGIASDRLALAEPVAAPAAGIAGVAIGLGALPRPPHASEPTAREAGSASAPEPAKAAATTATKTSPTPATTTTAP